MKGRGRISAMSWQCVKVSAELLAPLEREVVLGDLAETDREDCRGLGDVLSLVALRQLALWRGWRPWAASAGLALPASLFLMGLWGAWRGRRDLRLGFRWAIFLTAMAMITPFMWGKGGWMYGCWLLWPGWYPTAMAKRRPV